MRRGACRHRDTRALPGRESQASAARTRSALAGGAGGDAIERGCERRDGAELRVLRVHERVAGDRGIRIVDEARERRRVGDAGRGGEPHARRWIGEHRGDEVGRGRRRARRARRTRRRERRRRDPRRARAAARPRSRWKLPPSTVASAARTPTARGRQRRMPDGVGSYDASAVTAAARTASSRSRRSAVSAATTPGTGALIEPTVPPTGSDRGGRARRAHVAHRGRAGRDEVAPHRAGRVMRERGARGGADARRRRATSQRASCCASAGSPGSSPRVAAIAAEARRVGVELRPTAITRRGVVGVTERVDERARPRLSTSCAARRGDRSRARRAAGATASASPTTRLAVYGGGSRAGAARRPASARASRRTSASESRCRGCAPDRDDRRAPRAASALPSASRKTAPWSAAASRAPRAASPAGTRAIRRAARDRSWRAIWAAHGVGEWHLDMHDRRGRRPGLPPIARESPAQVQLIVIGAQIRRGGAGSGDASAITSRIARSKSGSPLVVDDGDRAERRHRAAPRARCPRSRVITLSACAGGSRVRQSSRNCPQPRWNTSATASRYAEPGTDGSSRAGGCSRGNADGGCAGAGGAGCAARRQHEHRRDVRARA